MGPVTILFGVLFFVLGPVGYFGGESHSWTAWIPSMFGVVFIVLGLLARQDRLRMHVMHAAALLGLLAVVGGLMRAVPTLVPRVENWLPVIMQLLMAALGVVFVGLCVKSFVDARRRRKQQAGTA